MRFEGKRSVRDEMWPEQLRRIGLFTEIGNTEESQVWRERTRAKFGHAKLTWLLDIQVGIELTLRYSLEFRGEVRVGDLDLGLSTYRQYLKGRDWVVNNLQVFSFSFSVFIFFFFLFMFPSHKVQNDSSSVSYHSAWVMWVSVLFFSF